MLSRRIESEPRFEPQEEEDGRRRGDERFKRKEEEKCAGVRRAETDPRRKTRKNIGGMLGVQASQPDGDGAIDDEPLGESRLTTTQAERGETEKLARR